MNIVNLNFGEALTREQMKQVTGGSIKGGSDACDAGCSTHSDCGTNQLCVDVSCPSDRNKTIKGCVHEGPVTQFLRS
ncbi:hypothetical protein SAMN05660226_00117 [Parapedobacter luteus]|uniref:Uncharacterized protein n=1 Tax=Parapedobacter luteus TaxID=623280 RepID=A0A1T4ZUK1_9SPHI|nr:hypothetical protein SAMN05660226_00117 [Parapedobacter luteus]